jgi:hypothetical protein
MVSIFYWHPNSSDNEILQKGKNDFGHISISAKHEAEIAYLSFYPNTRLPLASLMIPTLKVPVDLKTFEEDIKIFESEPDYTIELSNIETKKVYEYIISLQENRLFYNLYMNNCACIVYDALMHSSSARKMSIQYFLFKFYYKKMKYEKMELKISLQGYSRMFYRFFEKAGFISPFRVLSFAKFIKNSQVLEK